MISEKEIEKLEERNNEYIEKFSSYLKNKNLSPKTIKKHISNINLFLNCYMIRYSENYDLDTVAGDIDDFVSYFFIRKCMWSNESSTKELGSSLKKFYQCMAEEKIISQNICNDVIENIKDSMECWIEEVNEYNNFW